MNGYSYIKEPAMTGTPSGGRSSSSDLFLMRPQGEPGASVKSGWPSDLKPRTSPSLHHFPAKPVCFESAGAGFFNSAKEERGTDHV